MFDRNFRLIFCVTIASLLLHLSRTTVVSGAEVDLNAAAEKVVRGTNVFRKEHDLDSLEVDKTLQDTARKFAEFMAETGKYGHRADGRSPAERATASGYDYCVVRENIAYRTDTRELTAESLAEHFTQGWIDSPEHRESMLADFVTETAVALATDDGTTFYAVQLFGRPKAMSYRVTVSNQSETKWTLSVESNGSSDEIEIPPRGRLRMKRCFPIALSIVDTKTSRKIEKSSELEIHETSEGPIFKSASVESVQQ